MSLDKVETWVELIRERLPQQKEFTFRIKGDSMLPILKEGDVVNVIVCQEKDYKVGDILVFPYKKEGFIIHRLLRMTNGRYFCKGDNAFRLEDISGQDIIGRVNLLNDNHNNQEFVDDSLNISKVFRRCKFNVQLTKFQKEYIEYVEKYMK